MTGHAHKGATRALGSRRRLVFLTLGMAVVGVSVVIVVFLVLYGAAFEGQRARLVETARSRARFKTSNASSVTSVIRIAWL